MSEYRLLSMTSPKETRKTKNIFVPDFTELAVEVGPCALRTGRRPMPRSMPVFLVGSYCKGYDNMTSLPFPSQLCSSCSMLGCTVSEALCCLLFHTKRGDVYVQAQGPNFSYDYCQSDRQSICQQWHISSHLRPGFFDHLLGLVQHLDIDGTGLHVEPVTPFPVMVWLYLFIFAIV